jgi:hypothetical protein
MIFPGTMMPLLRLIAVAIFASSPVLLIGLGAAAEPLDKEACANLQLERKKLLTRDMQAALDKGPDWVKDHLNDEEIEQVRAFLAVEEKIEFRCRGGGVAKPTVPATTAGGVPLPDRNPNRPPTVTADTEPSPAVGDSDKPGPSTAPETGPSQTVADSDKTAPSKTKTTR